MNLLKFLTNAQLSSKHGKQTNSNVQSAYKIYTLSVYRREWQIPAGGAGFQTTITVCSVPARIGGHAVYLADGHLYLKRGQKVHCPGGGLPRGVCNPGRYHQGHGLTLYSGFVACIGNRGTNEKNVFQSAKVKEYTHCHQESQRYLMKVNGKLYQI